MLNRRSLRIKVAQNLYAYFQRRQANYELAFDEIKTTFVFGFDTPDNLTKEDIASFKEQAIGLLTHKLKATKPETEDYPEEVLEAVEKATTNFHNSIDKDTRQLEKNLVVEAEKVADRYLLVLDLLIEFQEYATGETFKKKEKYRNENLVNNKIIKAIKEHNELQNLKIRKNVNWAGEHDQVRQWYKGIIAKDEEFKKYSELENSELEDDRQFCNYLLKSIILKNQEMVTYFESMDIAWEENMPVVKSMAVKTIKSIEAEDPTALEVSQLSYNWEDDRDFFKELFTICVKKDEEFEQLVAEKTKNWDIHRLAIMDKIIIKMAICEMIGFPSIPVKVTINEYIEISKRYSTPKSKQFVNGLLDSLANKLSEDGLIRKSGRGLIDNK